MSQSWSNEREHKVFLSVLLNDIISLALTTEQNANIILFLSDNAMWLQWDFFLMYHSLWRGILVVKLAKAISMFSWQLGFKSSMKYCSCHLSIFNISTSLSALENIQIRISIATSSRFETGHIFLWKFLCHMSVLWGKIPEQIILSCWHSGWALLSGHAQVNQWEPWCLSLLLVTKEQAYVFVCLQRWLVRSDSK